MRRIFFGFLLTLGLIITCFLLAGMFAGAFVVHPGDGLAGSATVAVYGMGGAVVGLVAGVLLALKLAPKLLPRIAIIVFLLSIVTFGVLIWRGVQRQRARQAAPFAAGMYN
jgi:hypothetical protein